MNSKHDLVYCRQGTQSLAAKNGRICLYFMQNGIKILQTDYFWAAALFVHLLRSIINWSSLPELL